MGLCGLSSKLEVGGVGNLKLRLMLDNIDCMSRFSVRFIHRFWNQSLEILKEVWGKALTSFSPVKHFLFPILKLNIYINMEKKNI